MRTTFKSALILLVSSALLHAGALKVTSPDFTDSKTIPSRFTCEGENTSPGIEISGLPAGTKSLTLIVDDPDAPTGLFTHWIVYNIPPTTTKIATATAPQGEVGTNDFGRADYSGPCPPAGTHRYYFRVYALNAMIDLHGSPRRQVVDGAIRSHILAEGEIMGTFSK